MHPFTPACRCLECSSERIHAHLTSDDRLASEHAAEVPRKGRGGAKLVVKSPRGHYGRAVAMVDAEDRFALGIHRSGMSGLDAEAEAHAQADRERVGKLIDQYEAGWTSWSVAKVVSVMTTIETICERHSGIPQLPVGRDLGEAFHLLCKGRASWRDVAERALVVAINAGHDPR